MTSAVLAEYHTVLSRPTIRDDYRLSDSAREFTFSVIRRIALHVVPTVSITGVTADPKDEMFIEAAVASQADFIVSGDKHLLTLGEYDGIRIITPAMFVAYLSAQNPIQ